VLENIFKCEVKRKSLFIDISYKRLLKQNLNLKANQVAKTKTPSSANWSAKVTRESNALDLQEGVFTWKDPEKIALSLKHSADTSTRLKSSPFHSAMSMLVFYINRAGKNLHQDQKIILQQTKVELRKLYNKL